MSLAVGNLLNASANLASTISNSSLKSFLKNINNFGVQVKNNFEINFSGLPDIKIFVQQISFPELKQNYVELNYNARRIEIPINYDYGHDFSMTLLNDAQGYIYNEILKFVLAESNNIDVNTGYTINIRALTGDTLNYGGSLIVLKGVRIESITGLDYGYDQSDIQTFTINCKCTSFEMTPGLAGGIANVLGSLNGLA